MSLKHILTFKREPVSCDLAEVYCPVSRPCNNCNEHFNALPLLVRVNTEIPRRISLLRLYGWRAFWRGMATEEEVRSKFHGVTWFIHKPKGFVRRRRTAIFGDRREG